LNKLLFKLKEEKKINDSLIPKLIENNLFFQETYENKIEEKQLNNISTADNSEDTSINRGKNDSFENLYINRYYMALKPLQSSKNEYIESRSFLLNNCFVDSEDNDFIINLKYENHVYPKEDISNSSANLIDDLYDLHDNVNFSIPENTRNKLKIYSSKIITNIKPKNCSFNYNNHTNISNYEDISNLIKKNTVIEDLKYPFILNNENNCNFSMFYTNLQSTSGTTRTLNTNPKTTIFNENNFNIQKYSNWNSKKTYENLPYYVFKKEIIALQIFQDLYEELISEDRCYYPCFGYMVYQTDINEKMRAVLIDWLSEVHLKFKLAPENLFLTVKIIDRYLTKQKVSKNNLQLLGVGALLISCKFQEIFFHDINDFVYITDKAYSKQEIILMEKEILRSLDYKIIFPSILEFYDLLSVNFGFSEKEYYLGRYFVEMFLLDYRINKYSNSLVACSAVYLVLKINKNEDYKLIYRYTFDDEKNLKNCAKEILFLLENIESTKLLAIKNKYASKEFHEVSKILIK